MDLALAKAGKKRRSVVEVAHVLLVHYLIQDTDMIACFPEGFARHFCPRLGLEMREPPFALHAYEGSLIWHRRFDQDGGHVWLRERIEALCAKKAERSIRSQVVPAASGLERWPGRRVVAHRDRWTLQKRRGMRQLNDGFDVADAADNGVVFAGEAMYLGFG